MAYSTLIRSDELEALLDADCVVLDCRFDLAAPEAGRAAYDAGHIRGAVYADLNRDLSAPVVPGVTGRHPLPLAENFAVRLGRWGISNERQVVAYDDSGGAIAARLWWMLRWLGHDAVAVLDGGLTHWLGSGRTLTTEPPKVEESEFLPRLRQELLVTAEQVQAAQSDSGCVIMDARASARFRGEQETIDPVAGHIPGAVSAPFSENLEAGSFKSQAALRQRFDGVLGGAAAERAVVYCGSGVTACHDILAMQHAGLDGARLYAGSWSEWITRESRGVAVGGT